jgi:phenylacetate-coenzyme A ligase PaaK-like adenylate-forming protein
MTTTAMSDFGVLRASLMGSLVADHAVHQERLHWNRDQIEAHQGAELRALLTHAKEHSPFHGRRLAGVDTTSTDLSSLSALPVMTKAQMMESFDDVVTDRRLSRAMVEDSLARTGAEPLPILDSYVAYTSGGSSGLRGVFVYDREATRQFVGSFTRPLVARLAALGGPPPGGLPIAFVAAPSAIHMTGMAQAMTAGGELGFRYITFPATLPMPDLVARLNEAQLPALAGYASMLTALAHERRAGRLEISPIAVSATSEPLSTEDRELISSAFGVPVVNTFGATEGLVGTTPPDDDGIVFAEDGCIVELVDENDDPVPAGTPSAKVLLTNLNNRVQPLIRYELTDCLTRLPDSPQHGYLRAKVAGRLDDLFEYGNVIVHPLVMRSVLVKTPGITEYQVRQTTRGIDVSLVASADVRPEAVSKRLTAALGAAGLDSPAVSTRIVAQLDRSALTGKFRRFVPLV